MTAQDGQDHQQYAGPAIEANYIENRTFPPPESFVQGALVVDDHLYRQAEADWQGVWAKQAEELVSCYQPWQTVCEWEPPFARWFVGGKLNISYNCLDRHVEA